MGPEYKERYEYSLDSRQLGVVLLGVVGLAALIFVLGVSVGRQWEKSMGAPPEARVSGPDESAMPVAPAVEVPAEEPADPGPPTDSAPDDEAAPKEEETPDRVTAGELTFPKTLTDKEPGHVSKKAPSKKQAKADKPQATPQPGAAYTVQVGAFKEDVSARTLVNKLKKKGYPAEYALQGGVGGLYKVRVGSFASLAEARKMSVKLESIEGLKPYVTSY